MTFLKTIFNKDVGIKAIHFIYYMYMIGVSTGVLVQFFTTSESIREDILLALFGSVFVLFMIHSIFTAYSLSRKAKYAESLEAIHLTVHLLRDHYRWLECCSSQKDEHSLVQFNESTNVTMLTEALTSMSKAFCIATSVNCRASIKLLGRLPDANVTFEPVDESALAGQLFVKTLARDAVSKKLKADQDGNERYKHLLTLNSDFLGLFNGSQRRYFFHGKLGADGSYSNSNDDASSRTDSRNLRVDYNSTIVWPIRYRLKPEEMQEIDARHSQVLLGFLTIDAVSTNAFSERYDVQMGAIVADTLYHVLQSYREIRFDKSG